MTLNVLGIMVLSLFAQSIAQLLNRAFYAINDTKSPLYVDLVSEAVNFLCIILLIHRYAINGLAIAFSVSAIVDMGLMFYLLKKKVDCFSGKIISIAVSKILLATLAASLAAQISKNLIVRFIEINTFVGIAIQLVAATLIGSGMFILFCVILNVKEFYYFKRSIFNRMPWSKSQITEITDEIEGI